MRLGPRPVPGRDRRRHGDARQEDLPGRAARRRLGPAPRRDERSGRRSGSGGRGRGTSSVRRPTAAPTSATPGFPFLTSKTVDIDGVRTLASRISYVGELGWEIYVPIEQGLRVWDAHLGGRPAARARAGRDRDVRGDVAAREGLSRARRRARARLRPRRGRHGPTDGQGPRLRRPRGLPPPARRGAGRRPVHADRRRPHVDERREALHARPRADPAPRTAARWSTRRAAGRT